jgi:hypothetical protein
MDNLERIKLTVEKAYKDAARVIDVNGLKAATLLDCYVPEEEPDMCRVLVNTVDDIKIFCVVIAKIEVRYVGDQSIFLEVPLTINRLSTNDSDVVVYHEVLSQLHDIDMAMELRDMILNSLAGFCVTSYMINLLFGSVEQYRKKLAIALSRHLSK